MLSAFAESVTIGLTTVVKHMADQDRAVATSQLTIDCELITIDVLTVGTKAARLLSCGTSLRTRCGTFAAKSAGHPDSAILAFFGVDPKKLPASLAGAKPSLLGRPAPDDSGSSTSIGSTRRKPRWKQSFGKAHRQAELGNRGSEEAGAAAQGLLSNTFFGWTPKKSPLC
jgi:hypothetical protein